MPKMKTHRGAAKRFKKTGKGQLKRYKAYKSHNHISSFSSSSMSFHFWHLNSSPQLVN